MAKKHKEEKEPNHERWLLTYADLITLLMIFFVVLYSMARTDVAKFKALSGSLAQVFGGGRSLVGDHEGKRLNPPLHPYPPDLQSMQRSASGYLSAQGLTEQTQVVLEEEQGLVITLDEAVLFEPGQVEVTAEGREKLLDLARMFIQVEHKVRVEVYSGRRAKDSGMDPWRFTSLRAASVVQVLARDGAIGVDRLEAAGFGESRPLVGNDTEAARRANNRVRIVIEIPQEGPKSPPPGS